MLNYKISRFPDSRIASIDICEIGKQKHHVAGLIEFDVTDSRKKIREYNKSHSNKISFNAWMISVIGHTLKKHETISSYLIGRNRQIIFNDINISVVVEKNINGTKVPIPLVIEKANEASIDLITKRIEDARNAELTENEIVFHRKTQRLEKLYYSLPNFLRRYFWRYIMKHPKLAFKKMGNVAFTSLGASGKANGWFIPISVHPVCFGVSSITKAACVVDNKIDIRDILKMTVLIDHDVIDGAPMARFVSDLTQNIETGLNIITSES